MTDRLKQLFEQAIDLPPERRSHLVERVGGEDPELQQRLAELLSAHDEAGDFLEHPTGLVDEITAAVEGLATSSSTEAVGDRIDRFVLTEELGQGGFGKVWRARQEQPVEREVALKILHARLDSPQLADAFHAERQSLARMRHPSIAKVFEAGVADGRPWLAMELVDGEPIVKASERRALDLRARLALFAEVCRAIQYAHRKGVVHRDLKPSNVLLTADDGRLRPVVIDFGVAGSLDDRGRGSSGPFGTPEYMSPEQAACEDAEIDIRTDVHALGVLFYELVTRRRPFARAASEGKSEVLRRVREELPPPPGRVPGSLSRRSRDLDEVAARALAKDPAQRYQTALALAEDVERYLRHEPIGIREHDRGYRLRRFVRRHRLAVGALLLVVITTTTAAVVATRGWLAASAAERSARRALDVLDEVWLSADTSRFARTDYPVRELFADFERALPGLVHDEPAVAYRVRLSMARLQRSVGDFDRAGNHADRAVDIARRGGDAIQLADALLELGRVRYRQNAAAEAVRVAEEGLQVVGLHGPIALRADFESLLADASFRVGAVDRAIAAADRAMDLRRATGDPAQLAHGEMLLANLHGSTGRVEVALAHLGNAQALLADGADLGDVLVARQHEAMLLQRRGDRRQAEAVMRDCYERRRELYGAGHPVVASTATDLAWMLHDLGRDAEAKPLLQGAIADLRERLGEGHLMLTESMQRLGAVEQALGDLDEAERLLRAATARYRELPAHPVEGLVGCMGNLASLLWTRGQRGAGVDVQAQSLAIAGEELPGDHYVLSVARTNYAYMLQATGEREAAVELLRLALASSDATGRVGDARVQRERLVALLRELGRADEADRVEAEADK